MKNILYTIILSFLFSSSVFADFEAGKDAYNAGDYETAYKEWKALAEQGHTKAQIHVYMMYSFGEGVTQDDKEAMKWLRLAVEQGDARAQLELGAVYKAGLIVTRDFKEAMKWIRLAAEQGYADAQFALGQMHLKGQGVTQDYIIANMWFNIAANSAANSAARNAMMFKDTVESKMTSEQLLEAQNLTRECIKKNYKNCGY